jgi:hypothetical protein
MHMCHIFVMHLQRIRNYPCWRLGERHARRLKLHLHPPLQDPTLLWHHTGCPGDATWLAGPHVMCHMHLHV